MPLLRSTWIACRSFFQAGWTVALWSLWLALGVLLAIQSYIAFTSELAVPDFLLRRFERQLAESGLRITFARTSFDPTGRVLIENARVSLPEYPEPVLVARAIYLQFNPWMLSVGRFEPREIRLTGANFVVPAMLSSSGASEEIIRGVEATVTLTDRRLDIAQFNAQMAGVPVFARGAVAIPHLRPGPQTSLAELVSTRFPIVCRQAMQIAGQLKGLEAPILQLEFEPSESGPGVSVVQAGLLARRLMFTTPFAADASGVDIAARITLAGGKLADATARVSVLADEVRFPLHGSARGIRAGATGRFTGEGFRFEPRAIEMVVDAAESSGFTAEALSARIAPLPLPRLEIDAVAHVMGGPLAVRARADVAERSAALEFSGAISPRVLEPLGGRLNTDVRRFFDFAALRVEDGEARFGPGWKFEKFAGRVALRDINARGVSIEEGRAVVQLDANRFYSPDAFARIGANFARGSYEQDLQTRQFRFLLDGQLRPLDISGWFREWWPRFFQRLEFPAAAPVASVDVSGVWREGWRTSVFIAAAATQPVLWTAGFDDVQTRLFIRPGYVDGLEFRATHNGGAARGTFTHTTDLAQQAWRSFELELASNIDPALGLRILGPLGERLIAPYKFTQMPAIKLKGRFDGPAAPGGRHQTLQLEASSGGEFQFYGFPLEDVAFKAAMRDREIDIEELHARFAGGILTGRVRLSGPDADRRVNFDTALKDASLGQTVLTLQRYFALRQNRPPTPAGKFVQEKAAVRLDLKAAAEGRYPDPLSFNGQGTVDLQGAGIGEVSLLGLLSELLRFTTLRLTSAHANFKIEGPNLQFPEVRLRGSDSAIDAHGDYRLDRRELDFNAKVLPFQESGNLIKSVFGAVLTPLTSALEVKLTGSLEKPEWAFVMGPTNLLRSLAPDQTPTAPAATPAAPSPVGNPPASSSEPPPAGSTP